MADWHFAVEGLNQMCVTATLEIKRSLGINNRYLLTTNQSVSDSTSVSKPKNNPKCSVRQIWQLCAAPCQGEALPPAEPPNSLNLPLKPSRASQIEFFIKTHLLGLKTDNLRAICKNLFTASQNAAPFSFGFVWEAAADRRCSRKAGQSSLHPLVPG